MGLTQFYGAKPSTSGFPPNLIEFEWIFLCFSFLVSITRSQVSGSPSDYRAPLSFLFRGTGLASDAVQNPQPVRREASSSSESVKCSCTFDPFIPPSPPPPPPLLSLTPTRVFLFEPSFISCLDASFFFVLCLSLSLSLFQFRSLWEAKGTPARPPASHLKVIARRHTSISGSSFQLGLAPRLMIHGPARFQWKYDPIGGPKWMRPAFIAIRRVGVPFLIVTSFLLGSLVGFTKVLLGFTGFRSSLVGFTRFYWVLLGFTGFYWVLLGFTRISSEFY